MGKYSGSSTQRESSISKPKETPLIWRGIGCLMMVIIPAISIIAGNEIVKYALENKWRIPYQLLGVPHLPDIIYKSSGLKAIFVPLTKIPNLYAYILASFTCMVLISSLISLAYAVAYRVANPNRYGPTDAPPPKVRITKKSR
jgi:hypothetical protein